MSRRSRRSPDDGGFTLVEVVVAMVLLVSLGATFIVFFSRTSALSQSLARKQAAVALADEAIELVKSVNPRGTTVSSSLLLSGRTTAAVDAQWAAAPADVVSALVGTARASDPAATSSSVPVIPLRSTATVNRQPYTIDRYVGTCRRPTTLGATAASCTSTAGTGVVMLRVVVAVSWSEGTGKSCAGSTCRFVLSTLVDPLPDAQFMVNGGSVGGAVGVAKPDAVTISVSAGRTVEINVKSNDLGTLSADAPVKAVTPVGNRLIPGVTLPVGVPLPVGFQGTVTLGGASVGAVTYTAPPIVLIGYIDTFTYTLVDAAGRESTTTVAVTVTP